MNPIPTVSELPEAAPAAPVHATLLRGQDRQLCCVFEEQVFGPEDV